MTTPETSTLTPGKLDTLLIESELPADLRTQLRAPTTKDDEHFDTIQDAHWERINEVLAGELNALSHPFKYEGEVQGKYESLWENALTGRGLSSSEELPKDEIAQIESEVKRAVAEAYLRWETTDNASIENIADFIAELVGAVDVAFSNPHLKDLVETIDNIQSSGFDLEDEADTCMDMEYYLAIKEKKEAEANH